MKKKVLAVLLSSMMTIGLMTGCSSGAKDTSVETTPTKAAATEEAAPTAATDSGAAAADGQWEYKEATLTFLIDSDVSLNGFNAVAALAKEKLGITIETELRAGGSDGDNLVKTRLASGEMCDLLGYNSGSLLAALNPTEYFIDISQYDWSKRLDDTYVGTVSSGNQIFGVPLTSAQAGAVLYNKDLYAKYNLQVPKTWDEFVANCKVLDEAGETAMIGAFGDSWTSQVLFLGDYYNVLAKDPNFTSGFEAGTTKYATSEAGLSSFKKYEDLLGLYNDDYLASTYDDACDMMANGEGAHWFMLTQALSNIYSLYDKETVDKIGVFGVPGEDASNQGLTVWMPTSIYGNKNSDKYDDIVRFMEFYVSDEALNAMTEAQLPDGPFCVKGYQLPDNAYEAVKTDMQAYFDAGKTSTAQEFQTSVKGSNCPAICQEAASGQVTGEKAAKEYDEDCYKQAIQLGLDWKE
jgi:raffinose/stachyose/melibiose transport system substrate-binding protein